MPDSYNSMQAELRRRSRSPRRAEVASAWAAAAAAWGFSDEEEELAEVAPPQVEPEQQPEVPSDSSDSPDSSDAEAEGDGDEHREDVPVPGVSALLPPWAPSDSEAEGDAAAPLLEPAAVLPEEPEVTAWVHSDSSDAEAEGDAAAATAADADSDGASSSSSDSSTSASPTSVASGHYIVVDRDNVEEIGPRLLEMEGPLQKPLLDITLLPQPSTSASPTSEDWIPIRRPPRNGTPAPLRSNAWLAPGLMGRICNQAARARLTRPPLATGVWWSELVWQALESSPHPNALLIPARSIGLELQCAGSGAELLGYKAIYPVYYIYIYIYICICMYMSYYMHVCMCV